MTIAHITTIKPNINDILNWQMTLRYGLVIIASFLQTHISTAWALANLYIFHRSSHKSTLFLTLASNLWGVFYDHIIPGFTNHCPCGVGCRGLNTFLLYVSLLNVTTVVLYVWHGEKRFFHCLYRWYANVLTGTLWDCMWDFFQSALIKAVLHLFETERHIAHYRGASRGFSGHYCALKIVYNQS